MAGVDDNALVARAVAQHDAAAFGELVKRHQSRVRNFLRKMTRDVETADDLAQDAFLHAWDRLHTFTGSGSFVGWLMSVAYTTFLQSKRRSGRYREVLEAAGREPDRESVSRLADEIGDLDRFLAVLTEEERAVMILSYACGLSHREIGAAANLPIGTVKSIIFRSKEKVRDAFEIGNDQQDHKTG
jgi:RNA polymerase sigma-70 factor (ECF subfamily)